MLYKKIFNDEFLNKFGDYKEKISNIILDDNCYEIDVEKIANLCEICLKYDGIGSSGFGINNEVHSDYDNKIIMVNKFNSDYIQKVTIASELGHIVLGHKNTLDRFCDKPEYKDTIYKMNKLLANKFAMELIMPKKLVKEVLNNSINQLNYSINQIFYDDDIHNLVVVSAKSMGVSTQAFNYRIKDLGVFVDFKK